MLPRPPLRLPALASLSLLSLGAALAACSSSGGNATTTTGGGGSGSTSSSAAAGGNDGGGDAGSDAGPIGGDRPVSVNVPNSYTQGVPTPLLILLHGYGASGTLEDAYLGFTPEAEKRGWLYAHPDGTVDPATMSTYWNASDACCAPPGSTVDDSTYLSQLIKDISAHYTVDPKRVYFVGHSNGGFMSYRMACDHADQIAAFVSLAGAMPADVTKCNPSQPVSMLEIHGTADMVIAYDGAAIAGHSFPGATTSVGDWVTLDGCSPTADTTPAPLDLEASIPGDETTVTRYAAGCKAGGHAELWTIMGGSHIPNISAAFTPDVFDFLAAHARP
jgi:polyhydroxybutyrate depolymerase